MLIEVTQRMNYQVLQASCTHWQVSIWQTICRILPHFSALNHFKCQVTIKWRIGTCSVLSKVGQCVRAAGSSPRFVKLQGWWWNPAKIPQTVSADKWSPDCYGSSEKWLCSVRLIEEGLFLFGVFMCWKIFWHFRERCCLTFWDWSNLQTTWIHAWCSDTYMRVCNYSCSMCEHAHFLLSFRTKK